MNFQNHVYTPENYVTCSDAISDLHDFEDDLGSDSQRVFKSAENRLSKENAKKMQQILYNHVGTKHTPEVIDVISQVPEGGNHKDLTTRCRRKPKVQ